MQLFVSPCGLTQFGVYAGIALNIGTAPPKRFLFGKPPHLHTPSSEETTLDFRDASGSAAASAKQCDYIARRSFCSYKTQEDIRHIVFMKVLRGVHLAYDENARILFQ